MRNFTPGTVNQKRDYNMTARYVSENNNLILGTITQSVSEFYNADFLFADIPLVELVILDTSAYIPVGETVITSQVIIKSYLQLSGVLANTDVYEGVSGTYKIGSYNYLAPNFTCDRVFINYVNQYLGTMQTFIPPESSIGTTNPGADIFAFDQISVYDGAQSVGLYLPNAVIDGSNIVLNYAYQNYSTSDSAPQYGWTSMLGTIGMQ